MRRLKRILISLLLVIAALYLLLLGLLYVNQRNVLFQPYAGPTDPITAGLTGYTLEHVTTDDGLSLPYWHHPASTADAPLLLYFHGNGGGLHAFTLPLRRLAGQGYEVVAMEYRGYPGAPGHPTEADILRDADTLATHLLAHRPHRPVIIWGYSLGSGVATQLAARRNEDSVLILEAPFYSAVDLAHHYYPYLPIQRLMKDHFASDAHIHDIHAALFILHGTDDRIVPPSQSARLYTLASPPRKRITYKGADHFDLDAHGGYDAAFRYIRTHARAR